jgi:hypothetical protein
MENIAPHYNSEPRENDDAAQVYFRLELLSGDAKTSMFHYRTMFVFQILDLKTRPEWRLHAKAPAQTSWRIDGLGPHWMIFVVCCDLKLVSGCR